MWNFILFKILEFLRINLNKWTFRVLLRNQFACKQIPAAGDINNNDLPYFSIVLLLHVVSGLLKLQSRNASSSDTI